MKCPRCAQSDTLVVQADEHAVLTVECVACRGYRVWGEVIAQEAEPG